MDIIYRIENVTVCAYCDNQRIGKVGVPHIDLHWADGVYVPLAGIGGVGTEEAFRGQGIAGRMMDAAKTFAREKGYVVSGLTTNLGNNARRLYARAGYTTVFRPGRFEKRLHPVVLPHVDGITIRPYSEGDEQTFIRLFEQQYRSAIGYRAKTPESWRTTRLPYLTEEPGAFLVAEADGKVLGWTGIFRKWVGLCTEIWTVPDRGPVAQGLLSFMEKHHVSVGRTDCHIWASPQDHFMADIFVQNGYTFGEKRVFMLHVIDLPGLLRALLPSFNKRLCDSTWTGAVQFVTPEQQAVLQVGSNLDVAPDGAATVILQTDSSTLCRLLVGVMDPYEAYIENLLSVRPGYTSDIHTLLTKLFPPLMPFHPADDLW